MGIGERTFPTLQTACDARVWNHSLYKTAHANSRHSHRNTHGTCDNIYKRGVLLWVAFKCNSGFVSCWVKDWHHLLYIFIHLYLTQKHNDCIFLINLKNVFLKSFNFIKLENKCQYHPPGILWGGSFSARAVIQRVRMNPTEVNCHCSVDTAKPERTGAAELSPNFSQLARRTGSSCALQRALAQ